MARVSEKALRPRHYVFTRVSADRYAALQPGVRELLQREKVQALALQSKKQLVGRHLASRHAENIMAGIAKPAPENDTIAALEGELDELRMRKKALFDDLRKSLAKQEPVLANSAVAATTAAAAAAAAAVDDNGTAASSAAAAAAPVVKDESKAV